MTRKAAFSPDFAAPIFFALGDATRLGLVERLCNEGPSSNARLTEGTSLTRQGIAKHLLVLEEAGLIRGEKLGRENIWQIEKEKLDLAQAYLDRVSARWDVILERLKSFVEDE